MKIGSREITSRIAVLAALLIVALGVTVWALATQLQSPMEADLRARLTRYYTEPVMQGGNFAGDWHDLPEDEQAWFPHLGAFAPPDEFESLSVQTAEQGTINFNGRRIPAIIAKVNIASVNRGAGTRTSGCMLVMEAKDGDFQVYRAINVANCDGSSLSQGGADDSPPIDVSEAAWKSRNDFRKE
jgi:hypothetical protein